MFKLTKKKILFFILGLISFTFIILFLGFLFIKEETKREFPPCGCTTNSDGVKKWLCVYEGDYSKYFPGKESCK